jgi:hypothetical protein
MNCGIGIASNAFSHAFTNINIIRGWVKTGILPFNRDAIPDSKLARPIFNDNNNIIGDIPSCPWPLQSTLIDTPALTTILTPPIHQRPPPSQRGQRKPKPLSANIPRGPGGVLNSVTATAFIRAKQAEEKAKEEEKLERKRVAAEKKQMNSEKRKRCNNYYCIAFLYALVNVCFRSEISRETSCEKDSADRGDGG